MAGLFVNINCTVNFWGHEANFYALKARCHKAKAVNCVCGEFLKRWSMTLTARFLWQSRYFCGSWIIFRTFTICRWDVNRWSLFCRWNLLKLLVCTFFGGGTDLHMKSYIVRTSPALTPARQIGARFFFPRGMEGWVVLGVGYMPWWFTCLQIVTRPCSNHLIATRPGGQTHNLSIIQRASCYAAKPSNTFAACWLYLQVVCSVRESSHQQGGLAVQRTVLAARLDAMSTDLLTVFKGLLRPTVCPLVHSHSTHCHLCHPCVNFVIQGFIRNGTDWYGIPALPWLLGKHTA